MIIDLDRLKPENLRCADHGKIRATCTSLSLRFSEAAERCRFSDLSGHDGAAQKIRACLGLLQILFGEELGPNARSNTSSGKDNSAATTNSSLPPEIESKLIAVRTAIRSVLSTMNPDQDIKLTERLYAMVGCIDMILAPPAEIPPDYGAPLWFLVNTFDKESPRFEHLAGGMLSSLMRLAEDAARRCATAAHAD